MRYLDKVQGALREIHAAGRYRMLTPPEQRVFADFSSNDYLALAADSRMVEALRRAKRVGAGGARLLGGRHREHQLLEEDAARWTGRERALLFSSGYLAAIGAIAVLAQFVDAIYSDALNHASIIDGIRLCGKPPEIYAHGNLPPRSQRRTPALIVTESLFGMDGDLAGIAAIAADLNEGDILLVDEAHALGILGREAAGVCADIRGDRIVVLGTLSKAIGAAGGFVAGPAPLIDLMVNAARTFIFDTALPPAIAFAARVGIMLARAADDRRARLAQNVHALRELLRGAPYAVLGAAATPIVPVLIGSEARALEVMEDCARRGVLAPAVRPPTVPPGTSRLRISLRSDHTREQVQMLADALTCTVTS